MNVNELKYNWPQSSLRYARITGSVAVTVAANVVAGHRVTGVERELRIDVAGNTPQKRSAFEACGEDLSEDE